jgi:hypothetical protein
MNLPSCTIPKAKSMSSALDEEREGEGGRQRGFFVAFG